MSNIPQTFSEMKESPYLSWFDTTQEGMKVTIHSYDKVQIERHGGEIENKFIIYFMELEKPMILNVVNRNTLKEIFGDNPQASINQQIILYYRDDIEFQGKPVNGLRLKRYTPPKLTKPSKIDEELPAPPPKKTIEPAGNEPPPPPAKPTKGITEEQRKAAFQRAKASIQVKTPEQILNKVMSPPRSREGTPLEPWEAGGYVNTQNIAEIETEDIAEVFDDEEIIELT